MTNVPKTDEVMSMISVVLKSALEDILGAFSLDENMDVESTRLEGVAKYFEGNPVNDIMTLNLELATGTVTLEDIQTKLEAAVKEYQEFLVKEPSVEPEVEKEETLEDFVSKILKDLPLESPEYAEMFGKHLQKGIEKLQSRSGRAEFYVDSEGEEKWGTISKRDGRVHVTLAGKEYVFPEEKTHTAFTTVTPEGFSGHYDEDQEDRDEEEREREETEAEDREREEADGIAAMKEESARALEKESMKTLQSVSVGPGPEELAVLDALELRLNAVKRFSQTDLELIRYWLRRQPDASELEIDSLPDEGLALIWRQIQFLRNMG